MNTYITALKAIKENFRSESAYRLTLARAYILKLSEKYDKRSEILKQVNLFLKAEGLKEISYSYVRKVLEPNKY